MTLSRAINGLQGGVRLAAMLAGLGFGFSADAAIFDYHVDPATGNDTTGNGSIAAPYATLSKAVAVVGVSTGKRIGIKRGTTLRNDQVTLGASNTYVGAYGAGARPELLGSSQAAVSSLTKVGNLYTLSGHTFDPFTLALTYGSGVIKLYMTALSGSNSAVVPTIEGEWTWFPATHATYPNQLKFYSTSTLTGWQVEVPQGGVARTGVSGRVPLTPLEDLSIRFWSGGGLAFEGSNSRALRVDASYNGADGKDVGVQAKDVYIAYGQNHYNGRRLGGGGGPGDGISFHSSGAFFSTGLIEFESCIGNTQTGVGNQSGCQVVTRHCYFEDNYYDLNPYNTAGTPDGVHDFYYNVIVRKLRNSPWFNSNSTPGAANEGTIVRVRNNTIYFGSGLTATQVCNVQGNTNTFDSNIFQSASAITNFGQMTTASGGAVETKMVFTNNQINGTTNVWRVLSTSFNQPQTNTGTLLTNPLMADPANGNFALQSGSPCINSGSNWGQTRDYAGQPIIGIPDRGAYERAA